MSRILRRNLSVDGSGRAVAVRGERLTDDGRGNMHVTSYRTLVACPGCRRPLEDVIDLRGRCDFCGQRPCCVHCETRCQVCSRRLCVVCRRGFAGQHTATVCPICLRRLQRRQAYEDRLRAREADFRRRLAFQREMLRVLSLRAQIHKAKGAAKLAAMRERSRILFAHSRRRGHG